ncbi:MAG: sterol desaturase family protein [Gammaproteobacteria bacterium]|jgi:lathosterol oxidase|nr:sterol desaturase family protein [Gammaproteobacteria bacterium]
MSLLSHSFSHASWSHLYLLFLSYRFLRYFILYPAIFFTFCFLGDRIAQYRIQAKHPSKKTILRELTLSISTFICFGLNTLLAVYFYKKGGYHLYFDWKALGIPYFFFSIILILVFHEIYHYSYHRFMHTNAWFYRHVHSTHHRFPNPTVFTSYAFHPIEALLHPLAFVIAPLILPLHFLAPMIALLISEAFNIMGHAGYEWMPQKWANKGLLRLLNKSTFHNYHHSHGGRQNYSLYTTVMDELFNTHAKGNQAELSRVYEKRRKD